MATRKSKTEANLISFKLILDSKNQIITELKYISEQDIKRFFKKEEALLLSTLIQRAKSKLDPLHEYLQREGRAL